MKISLCTVPCESVISRADSSLRSRGEFPIIPKIAICALIKYMESNGIKKNMYDFYDIDMLLPGEAEIADYFQKYQPDIVGLSAVVSTSYERVKYISAIIRKVSPQSVIVLGGNLSVASNVILRKTNVDICVHGDGENPWMDLIRYVKKNSNKLITGELEKIQGISFLNEKEELLFTGYGKRIDKDLFVLPDYEILKNGLKNKPELLNNYFRKGLGSSWFVTDIRSFEKHRKPNIAQIWASRGCVARCTFCQRSIKGYQTINLKIIENHLVELKKKFDVGYIHILDENFGSNRQHTRDLAAIMKKHDLLWIASGVRCKSFKEEDFPYYKENNCCGLKFGVESGSQTILDLMEKKFYVNDVAKGLKKCAENEIYSPMAVMVGYPGETKEDLLETGRFLGEICHNLGVHPKDFGLAAFYALPLPGTPLYEYAVQKGIIGNDLASEEKYLLSIGSVGAVKLNYLNLNGASLKNVYFWDWLIQLEASRVYFQLQKQKKIFPKKFMQLFLEHQKKTKTNRKGTKGFFKTALKKPRAAAIVLFDALFNNVEKHILPHMTKSMIFYLLPGAVTYPILKNLLFVEYKVKALVKYLLTRKYDILNTKQKKAPILDSMFIKSKENQNEKSLRRIVDEQRIPAKGITGKNVQTLMKGL